MLKLVLRIVEESVRFIISILLIAMVYMFIIVAGELYQQHQEIMNQTVQTTPEVSKGELSKRMKYHGTLFAYERETDRKWMFKNKKGVECKLFKEQQP